MNTGIFNKIHTISLACTFFLFASCSQKIPIANGSYVFQHKYAEHPTLKSILLNVEINGSHINVTNNSDSDIWPKGHVEDGKLFFHSFGRWIIIQNNDDKTSEEIGGCSDGPTVVDLEKKVYWTC